MTAGRLHVVGAGLAGLAAALAARRTGAEVVVHEAAPQAGGRCRSVPDANLDRVIDNGSHLILSANRAVIDHARSIGAADELAVGPAVFPFLDLTTGTRWALRPNTGPLPWWVLSPRRRVPGGSAADHLALAGLGWGPRTATVAGRAAASPLYRRLIEPLTVAILNTPPERASAALLAATLARSLGRGGGACRTLLARRSLAAALIDPAVARLRDSGVALRTGRRLQALDLGDGRVVGLRFRGEETVALAPQDRVILAVPPAAAHALMPGAVPRLATSPILNVHFRLAEAVATPSILGLIGGTAHWLVRRGDVASATVSAAEAWMAWPAAAIAERLWRDVARACRRPAAPLPPWRVIKERRATLEHSPGQEPRRPGPSTALATNLWLAGDWTATGLPCTLEGAVRSGREAARQDRRHRARGP
jgi:squalene-associated FAD-dependent desaturase